MTIHDEKPELPNVVYVYVYQDGDEFWFNAEDEIEGCAAKDEKRIVGVYELKETLEVTLEVKEKVIKKVIA